MCAVQPIEGRESESLGHGSYIYYIPLFYLFHEHTPGSLSRSLPQTGSSQKHAALRAHPNRCTYTHLCNQMEDPMYDGYRVKHMHNMYVCMYVCMYVYVTCPKPMIKWFVASFVKILQPTISFVSFRQERTRDDRTGQDGTAQERRGEERRGEERRGEERRGEERRGEERRGEERRGEERRGEERRTLLCDSPAGPDLLFDWFLGRRGGI